MWRMAGDPCRAEGPGSLFSGALKDQAAQAGRAPRQGRRSSEGEGEVR